MRRNLPFQGHYLARQLQLASQAGRTEQQRTLRSELVRTAAQLHHTHNDLFVSVTDIEKVRMFGLGAACSVLTVCGAVRVRFVSQSVWTSGRMELSMHIGLSPDGGHEGGDAPALSDASPGEYFSQENLTLWDGGNFVRSEVGHV